MDIDCLSEADKKAYIKEGCCFKCSEKGHRANDPVKHPKTRDDDKKKKGKKMVRRTVPDDEETSKIKELSDDEELDARRTYFETEAYRNVSHLFPRCTYCPECRKT